MSFIREITYHQQGRAPYVRHPHTDNDSLEVIQILTGDGNALIGDQTYPLFPGTLLFIDASTIHSLNPQSEETYCRNKLIVSRHAVEKSLQAVDALSLLTPLYEKGGACFTLAPDVAGEVDTVFRRMADNRDDSGIIYGAFIRLVTMMFPHERLYAEVADTRVERVLHCLHTRYAEPLTIDTLADEACISKYYLCRLFRAYTGMSIVQYLNEQRLTTARRLLTQTRHSITTIAQDCGFSSPSHFCALFHQREGMTPRDFRNIHAKRH